MNKIWIWAALACLFAPAAWAEPPPAAAPPYRPGVSLQPVAIYDKDGNPIGSFGGGAAAGSQEQDVLGSGTLAANSTASTIDISINGQSTVGLRFSGLAASGATVSYLQTIDGTTYTPVNELNTGTGVPSTTRTTDGQVRVGVAGRKGIRLQVTTAGTGTISVAWLVSVRSFEMAIGPLAPGANQIGTIGNAFGLEATQQQVASSNSAIAAATGAQADTAYGGSGSGSLVALSKGQYAILSALSAAYGAQGDTAATASGSSGSMIALTRAIRDRLAGTLSVSGTVAATQSGTWTVGLSAGAAVLADLRVGGAAVASGNPVPVTPSTTQGSTTAGQSGVLGLGAVTASIPSYATGQTMALSLDQFGNLRVVQGYNPNNNNGIWSNSIATNTNGDGVATFSRIPVSAASTNVTQAKSGLGRVYKIVACNTTTTPARLKFYDALSANVTVGTTAVKLSRPIPAVSAAGGLACASYDWADIGASFSTGITYALVTGAADSDTTAVAAGAITDLSVEVR